MYLALARKYRPQKFKDLIGQPHVIKTLQNAIEMDKLYPALIFSGMKGVGKTSASRILAKALNCVNGPAGEPCNECEICVEITEDKSSDYIEIDGASNNGVEEVRNLRETVKYKPLKNRFRVVVIDEVHMLSNSAWNALLKTVEEPPEHTYFIMATTDFHKIPATIVSRCQHFEFKRIPYEVIQTVLKEICQKENVEISDYALYLVSRSSDGSLRDAKKILDQSIAIASGPVEDKDVIDILGTIEEKIFIDLTASVLKKDRKTVLEQINILSERGVDLRFFFGEYLKFFRDLIVLKSLDDSKGLHNLNPEHVDELKEMLVDVGEVELLRYFNATKDLELTMKHTENPRLILEYMFLKLSYFPSLTSIEEVIASIKSGGSIPSNPPVESAMPRHSSRRRPVVEESHAPAIVPDSQLKSVILDHLQKEKPRLEAALKIAQLALNDKRMSIEISNDYERQADILRQNTDYFKDLVFRLRGARVDVEVVVVKGGAKERQKNEMEALKKDEKITGLMNTLKGKIVTIDSVKDNIEGGNNA
jgi:DNA polymerase-3 subunit gamma/tau